MQTIKEKTDKFNYIKIKNIYSFKRCHKESEKTSHKLGEGYNTYNWQRFQNQLSKDHLWGSKKKTKEKEAKNTNRHSQRRKHKWLTWEKMVDVISNQWKANYNHYFIFISKDVWHRILSWSAEGIRNYYNLFGKQFGIL